MFSEAVLLIKKRNPLSEANNLFAIVLAVASLHTRKMFNIWIHHFVFLNRELDSTTFMIASVYGWGILQQYHLIRHSPCRCMLPKITESLTLGSIRKVFIHKYKVLHAHTQLCTAKVNGPLTLCSFR